MTVSEKKKHNILARGPYHLGPIYVRGSLFSEDAIPVTLPDNTCGLFTPSMKEKQAGTPAGSAGRDTGD